MGTELLPVQHRLKSRKSFRYIQSRGRRWSGDMFILKAVPTEKSAASRFGFVTSEKVGKAVVRNKIKRRMREGIKALLASCETGWDVVVIARSDAADASYEEICQNLASGLNVVCRKSAHQHVLRVQ